MGSKMKHRFRTSKIFHFVVLVAISFCLSTQAQIAAQQDQEIKLPDTPAGRTLGKFVQAFNSGDLAIMKRFHKDTGGDEENAEEDLGFYQRSGGLKLHSVVSSSDSAITVLAQTKKDGQWFNFSINVKQQAPHAITELDARPAEPPSEKPEKRSDSPSPRAEKLTESDVLK